MAVFEKVGRLLKYLRDSRKRWLYRQWVEKENLPTEDVPQEYLRSVAAPEERNRQSKGNLLYVLLGALVTLVLLASVLLISNSC